MTEKGIIDCISALKSNYGGFDFSENELVSYVKLWDIQFKDYSDSIVSSAIMRLIATAEFRPNIAVIKKDIANNLVNVRDDFEVWELVHEASRNANYDGVKEFQKLPEDIRKAISVKMLREIANCDVQKMQFLRKEVLDSYHHHMNKERNSIMVSSKGLDLDLLDNEFYENGELPYHKSVETNQIETKEQDTESPEDRTEDDLFTYEDDDPKDVIE